jgi:hypothetical protein
MANISRFLEKQAFLLLFLRYFRRLNHIKRRILYSQVLGEMWQKTDNYFSGKSDVS